MASKGYINTLLNRVPAEYRTPLVQAFEHLTEYIRFGMRAHQDKAENFAGYRFDGTTHAVANTEFSIRHGLGLVPYLAIPILPLDAEGSQLVPLRVSRVADRDRMYFTSASTSAPISLYVEV